MTETLREKLQPQADVMSAGILAQCDMVNQKAPGSGFEARGSTGTESLRCQHQWC